jgi:uncharacterized membrane protein
MTKVILVLIVAAIIEAGGVIFLDRGLREIQGARQITVSEIARVVKSIATNLKIIGGMALEAVFFGLLLWMLSQRDASFIWPLSSLGLIFTALAAKYILQENVTALRWAGVLLITIGAMLTGYSEVLNQRKAPSPPPSVSAHPQ